MDELTLSQALIALQQTGLSGDAAAEGGLIARRVADGFALTQSLRVTCGKRAFLNAIRRGTVVRFGAANA